MGRGTSADGLPGAGSSDGRERKPGQHARRRARERSQDRHGAGWLWRHCRVVGRLRRQGPCRQQHRWQTVDPAARAACSR
eukprot:4731289-Alexandrium_andersonii.AAC.1